jgi:phage nucleotide-binding protein
VKDIAKETLTPKTLGGLPVKAVQERSAYYNILIYGDSGTGKTTLAGSADEVPSMRPVLFVDIEGGTESLRHSYPGVETVRVTTWKEMQLVYDVLHSGEHDYQTVVLDSLTEIQKFNMYTIMESVVQKRPDLDIDVPSMREWGKNLEQMRKFVRGFRDLEMHTIFTALNATDKDQKTGQVMMKPQLSGKLANEVAAFLDIVGYYYVKQIGDGEDAEFKRLLLTQKTDAQVAKDRSGKLPMVVEYPTMKLLHEIMSAPAKEPELVAAES